MSYVTIWIHCVWGTKYRHPYLTPSIKSQLYRHILDYSAKKGISIDCINGGIEHVHCLLSLKADQCLSLVVKQIKGESCHWINKNRITRKKFEWAHEYYAGSVGERNLHRVQKYIRNQEAHHQKQIRSKEFSLYLKNS